MAYEEKEPKPKIVAVPLDRARRARGEGVVAMPRSKVASLRAFRRIRADRFFGVLGAILIAIGILLIFTWERPPVVPKTFSIEWATKAENVQNEAIQLTAAQGSRTVSINVAGPNVTAVSWWMQWKDDQGDEGSEADNFSIEVKGPPGANLTLPATTYQLLTANITRTFLMSGIPEITSVPATTQAEARRKVGDQTNRTGIGTYEFVFSLKSLNGNWQDNTLRDRAPCSVPYCTQDTRMDLTFHFEAITYSPVFKRNF